MAILLRSRLFRSRRLSVGIAAAALLGAVLTADPAMASPDGAMVALSDAAGLQVAVQQDGGTSWKIETAASGAGWSSPSIVFQSGSDDVMLTSVRDDGSLWFFWQAPGATNWLAQEVAGPNSTEVYAQPAIVAEDPDADKGVPAYEMIVAQDQNDNGSTFYWQAWGTSTWSSEQLPTENGVALQPDIALTANESTIVVSYIASYGTSPQAFGIDELPFDMSGWSVERVSTGMAASLDDLSVVVQPNTGNLLVGAADNSGDAYFFWAPNLDSWNEENIATGNATQNFIHYIQPLAISGNEQGVTEGILNAAQTCDTAIAQQDGPHAWLSQPMACPTGSPTVPVLEDANGTDDEIGATVVGDGGAYFFWQLSETSTWHTETINGIKDVEYYTEPALISI
jgi:hypothetical protein